DHDAGLGVAVHGTRPAVAEKLLATLPKFQSSYDGYGHSSSVRDFEPRPELSFSVASAHIAETCIFRLLLPAISWKLSPAREIQFPKRPAPCGLFHFLGSSAPEK